MWPFNWFPYIKNLTLKFPEDPLNKGYTTSKHSTEVFNQLKHRGSRRMWQEKYNPSFDEGTEEKFISGVSNFSIRKNEDKEEQPKIKTRLSTGRKTIYGTRSVLNTEGERSTRSRKSATCKHDLTRPVGINGRSSPLSKRPFEPYLFSVLKRSVLQVWRRDDPLSSRYWRNECLSVNGDRGLIFFFLVNGCTYRTTYLPSDKSPPLYYWSPTSSRRRRFMSLLMSTRWSQIEHSFPSPREFVLVPRTTRTLPSTSYQQKKEGTTLVRMTSNLCLPTLLY